MEKICTYASKNNITLPLKYSSVGGAPVYRGTLRIIANVTPNRNAYVVYGSTEAEPISIISAEEKMELEVDQPDGLCVGKPVFKETVKVIQLLDSKNSDFLLLYLSLHVVVVVVVVVVSDCISDPINISEELEVPCGKIGELIVSGWHVNTYQVCYN